MDFALSDEQRAFREVLREFVDAEIRPVVREWEATDRYPTEIVARLRELGLFGMTVPPSFGGLGLDLVSFALVFEEISRGWMGIAGILGSHSLSCWMIARHGTPEQQQRYLPELATGQRRTGIALTEPDAGTDLQGIKTTARLDGDHYLVNGSKTWITNARYADPLPVLVKTDPAARPAHRGMSVLLVEQGTPGFRVLRDLPKLGYKGTESCEVLLADCRVPAGNLLGARGRGLAQFLRTLDEGRVAIAAMATGLAQGCVDESLRYARQRQAFGQPIGAFQAIQFKIADMEARAHTARLAYRDAAERLLAGEPFKRQAAIAKLTASETAVTNAREATQIYGGYGFMNETPVARFWRDSKILEIGEGTSEIQRLVIARDLGL